MINYLRLSVTDRCNLKCIYCVPEGKTPLVRHKDILSYEEMLRLVRVCVLLGVKKVRITGGEPLMRKGITWFIAQLSQIQGLEKISLTTNGVFLKEKALELKEAGLKGINISLDTLDPQSFLRITGHDLHLRVLEGIQACEDVGISPIKLNTVILKGINEREVIDMAEITLKKDWHVRFIEFMPISSGVIWSENRFLSHDYILSLLQERYGPLEKVEERGPMDGPARYYRIKGARGLVGLISPISHSFCRECNRIRVTARGGLKTCLFSEREIPILDMMRAGARDEDLMDIIQRAVSSKLRGGVERKLAPPKRDHYMYQIGG